MRQTYDHIYGPQVAYDRQILNEGCLILISHRCRPVMGTLRLQLKVCRAVEIFCPFISQQDFSIGYRGVKRSTPAVIQAQRGGFRGAFVYPI